MTSADRPPRWLVAVLLRLWPARVRARHADSLRQTLDAAWSQEPPAGAGRRLQARCRLLLDLAAAGLAARFERPAVRPSRESAVRACLHDARSAVRALAARPLFTSAVVLTLGLGLGSTTAIYAVVDAVLLRPLPYPDDGRLVLVAEQDVSRNLVGTSWPAIRSWQAAPELSSLAAYEESALIFGAGERLERVQGLTVSPEFFTTLGVRPAIGQVFAPGDRLFDPEARIVIADSLWRRHFGADAAVVGQAVTIEQDRYLLVGVMPPGFAFPTGTEFWSSLPAEMQLTADAPELRFLEGVGRLSATATIDQLTARVQAWSSQQPASRDRIENWQPRVVGLREHTRGGVGPAVMTVFGGVSLLLLVACANVAALFVANGRSRARELLTREALGAGRGRLMRLLLFEGLVLSFSGGAVAIALAGATRALVVALSAGQIPRIDGVALSPAVVGFSLTASLVATLLVATGPAWALTRRRTSLLTPASRGVVGSRASRRLFGGLVAFEFALAVMLVAGAGLLAGSYQRLVAVDVGVSAERLGVADVVLPLVPAWQPNQARRRFFLDLEDRLRTVSAIQGAAFASRVPLEPVTGGLELRPADRGDVSVRAYLQVVSASYLRTVGARQVAGRTFTDDDVDGAPPVIVLNDRSAAALFGDPQSAVGRTVDYRFIGRPVSATVIGVVGAVRYGGLEAELEPEFYVPLAQGLVLPMTLVYRTAGEPSSAVGPIRQVIAAADPTGMVALEGVTTLDARIAQATARPRFFLVLVGTFAILAFGLAACGIYGTTAYWLSERWREFGLRLALGASPSAVVRQFVGQGVAIACAGILAGLLATRLAGGAIDHLLFGVRAGDAGTLALAGLVMAGLALVGCWLPARRAGRISPAETLRTE